ncbi:MAG: U32 family peptidase [Firmicutes bacterium]|nr:U32 family peptidase [Bacillota bacterium]
MMELIAPAGDFDKLKAAAAYGADAVYAGGRSYGLRAAAGNFSDAELARAAAYTHERGVKLYVTANVFARESDLADMPAYFRRLAGAGADAAIISDPGVFALAREAAPGLDIHISTQANCASSAAVAFWRGLGAKRVILARELSLAEIGRIAEKTGGAICLEAFVHGAMCVAYSGRCLLSAYLTGRGANSGECAHPCRYRYALEEEKRPGLYVPVEEDGRGTYFMAAKDLCMAAFLPEMARAGVRALKIEGRMKSEYYAAAVTGVYRRALDDLKAGEDVYRAHIPEYLAELAKAGSRDVSTGFYFGPPGAEAIAYAGAGDKEGRPGPNGRAEYRFCGVVLEYDGERGAALIEQRNKFSVGDEAEFLTPRGKAFAQKIVSIADEDGAEIGSAPHPRQRVWVRVERPVEGLDMMRGKPCL